MRMFSAIGALILIACAVPATSRADGPAPGASPAAAAAAPGCRCPGIRHAARPHRYVRHVRHWRRGHPVVALLPAGPPPVYDPPIPDPWDPAYDRAMTLHFRSPAVSGIYTGEPGLPHTPPIHGIQSYRLQAGGGVLQYDGLTGQYIKLARVDAARAFPPVAAAPAAPPAP